VGKGHEATSEYGAVTATWSMKTGRAAPDATAAYAAPPARTMSTSAEAMTLKRVEGVIGGVTDGVAESDCVAAIDDETVGDELGGGDANGDCVCELEPVCVEAAVNVAEGELNGVGVADIGAFNCQRREYCDDAPANVRMFSSA